MQNLDKFTTLNAKTEVLSKKGVLQTSNMWILFLQYPLTGMMRLSFNQSFEFSRMLRSSQPSQRCGSQGPEGGGSPGSLW